MEIYDRTMRLLSVYKDIELSLIVTKHADELLDSALRYLIYQLKNEQAAMHLLDDMEKIYDCLEEQGHRKFYN